MRTAYLLFLVAFVLASASGAQPAQAGDKPGAAELASRIRARLDATARGDVAGWASFVADDCICGLETKASIQRSIAARPLSVKNWYGEILDLTVRSLGDAAVARYRITEYTDVGGQLASLQMWRTETYVRQVGRWMLIAGADTVIPQEPAAMKVESRIFDDYVGRYQYAPGAVDTITREGDHLFLVPSGEPRVELFPETESIYFAKGEPWRLVFVRGPSGTITSVVLRQQGQEWTATRVP